MVDPMGNKFISAVILAGGNSRRMGENKALLQLDSETMIERVVNSLRPLFNEIIVVTNDQKEYSMLNNIRFVKDFKDLKTRSSLIGLYSGLYAANSDYIFAVACDMPLLNIPLINFMKNKIINQDIIIPYINGFYEPLHAFYSKNCLRPMKSQLDKKDFKILNFFSRVNIIETINNTQIRKFDPYLNSFLNINNYEEYLEFKNSYLNIPSYSCSN